MPQSEFSAHTLSKKHEILPSAMGRTYSITLVTGLPGDDLT